MQQDFTLYTWSVSLYSGKARSYLIKQGADFQDLSPAHESYEARIRPAIGRWMIPVMETRDGEVIQDGAAIIDWYEANRTPRLSAFPKTPRQLVTAYIMEMFGGEGLLRPAMHYRWNFDADNKDFLLQQFGLFAMPHADPADRHAMALYSSGRMRKAAQSFGVNDATIPAIEAAYVEFLGTLNTHFTQHPYLLGGCPTLGDYGLYASLFAHLGRDPYPARLMKQRAPAVYRWTERMSASGADFPEFINTKEEILPQDAIPDTLRDVLRCVAEDYLPEIKAMIEFHNQWLAQNNPADGEAVGGLGLARGIGICHFDWRGVGVDTVVMPYRVFMLQRIHDAYDGLSQADRDSVDALLAETGLCDIMTTRCDRRVVRQDNLEVWASRA
jgi:glutathione S-transferase